MCAKNKNELNLWERLEKDTPTEDEMKWAFNYLLEHPSLTREQAKKDGWGDNTEEAARRRDLLLMMLFRLKVLGGAFNLFKKILETPNALARGLDVAIDSTNKFVENLETTDVKE